MEATQERPRLTLADVQHNSQHTLQDDLDAALARIEVDIEEHMAANLGEHPTKPYKVTVVMEVTATHRNLRMLSGRVDTTFPKIGRKHGAALIGRDGKMVLEKPAGQEPLPLAPGKKPMEMVA
jgi:hypothetical protein